MTKYLVHLHPGMSQVVISQDGYGPTAKDGLKEIGSFDLDINEENGQLADPSLVDEGGDHVFITRAREVLQDHLGDHNSTKGYTFIDRASNSNTADLDADMSTDAMETIEGTNAHPDASTQKGGVVNSQTGEHNPAVQEEGGKPDDTAANELAHGHAGEGEADGSESVADLKTRIAGITDKDELQKAYDDEKSGKNRTTAIAALEARAAELQAS